MFTGDDTVPGRNEDSVVQLPPPMPRAAWAAVAAAAPVLIALLIPLGRAFRYEINPDVVAYLRIAHYYAHGQFDLAVSGTWSPLLSWIIAPLLGCVSHPVFAGRIAMGVSAVIMWCGAVAVLCRLRAGAASVILGAWVVAACCLTWSVEGTTPDLLMGGLLCGGVAVLMAPAWPKSIRAALIAGVLLGAAYLAKAVALPVAFGVTLGIAALWILSGSAPARTATRSALLSLCALSLTALPWITILSLEYHRPVFTTVVSRAYAGSNPGAVWCSGPIFGRFHVPETGRISDIEEQGHLTFENDWTPLESSTAFNRQLRAIYRNSISITNRLAEFDWLRLGPFVVIAALLIHRPWRRNMARDRWRWAGVPVACVAGIYIPVHAGLLRYLYPAFPFLLAAAFGMVYHLTRTEDRRPNPARWLGLILVALSFTGPAVETLRVRFPSSDLGKGQAAVAYDLAERFKAAGIEGSIAGYGPYINGFYLAFFTGRPWHGGAPNATAADFRNSGADLAIIARYDRAQVENLDRDSGLESLDGILFASSEEAEACPAKVYRILPAQERAP